jgi:hypothetical protein
MVKENELRVAAHGDKGKTHIYKDGGDWLIVLTADEMKTLVAKGADRLKQLEREGKL